MRSEVQLFLGPPIERIGGVAQLGERLPCTQEAIGSSPFTSTEWKAEKVGFPVSVEGKKDGARVFAVFGPGFFENRIGVIEV